jgi:hypothetical protein
MYGCHFILLPGAQNRVPQRQKLTEARLFARVPHAGRHFFFSVLHETHETFAILTDLRLIFSLTACMVCNYCVNTVASSFF